ncbi:GLPGLI family protein [Terrimonas sp. NA20]|uniref:GLPGLI family protein n=1 Tax=Terrimonas ginsenosidimutans TaxID=2908004 RepID=A0ABS9KUN3_9BACT|nr:GLPGLI family protein [Terrimonas ginsenosidimutans]MCG2616041.1 GLPGLI family protein [Terrimonas ginsenosidimutans]
MKKFTIVVFILLQYLDLRSQEILVLNVMYDFSYVRDLADTVNRYKAEMILSVGKQTSRYTTRDLFNRNSPAVIKLNKQRQEKANTAAIPGPAVVAVGGPLLNVTNAGALINEEIFIDRNKSTIQTAGRVGFKNFHFTVSLPVINWKLSSDKKEICGYTCQKAVGDYGGRTFEAWFTTDLPDAFGPWKLHGLPGLILSARDTKNEISFECKEITKNEDPEELLKPFMNADRSIQVKPKEYSKVAGMFAKDPAAVAEGQLPGTVVNVRNLDSPEDNSIRKVVKYNPMELK